MSESTMRVGVYWKRGVWDRARSAYVADLDGDPDSPGSFVGWLSHALEEHAARTPQQRAELAPAELSIAQAVGKSFNKGHPLKPTVVEAVEDAIVTDRQELGRIVARSGFVKEAVIAAAEDARRRLGRGLPPPPAAAQQPTTPAAADRQLTHRPRRPSSRNTAKCRSRATLPLKPRPVPETGSCYPFPGSSRAPRG